MAAKVHDAAFLLGAVIAMVAFGLLIVLTRPAGPTKTEASPSPPAIASFSPIVNPPQAPPALASFSPIVTPTQAPATSAPAPTTAVPVPSTAAPTASPAPRT